MSREHYREAVPVTVTVVEDLTLPETIANPYPAYRALRDQSPLWGLRDLPPGTIPGQDEPITAWALLSHADVDFAVRHPEIFSSRDPQQDASEAPTLMLVNHDEPEHGHLRRLISAAFTRRRIEELRPWIDNALTELWEGLATDSDGSLEVEFVTTVAARVPAMVMARLLGIPDEDSHLLERWAPAFMLSADLTPEERNASNAEMVEYITGHLGAVVAGHRGEWDHLTQAMFDAEFEGAKLSPEEVARFCITLLVAGAETTTGLISNLAFELGTRPEIRDSVRADPELVDPLMDETLRLSGPAQRLFRVATQDVTVGGAEIRAGEWVALFFAAANHDPAVFPEPDVFRLDRPNAAQHLTFGRGIHFCLGAHLAKLEAGCVVSSLLKRYPNMSLGSGAPVKQQVNLLNNSFISLPIRLAPSNKS